MSWPLIWAPRRRYLLLRLEDVEVSYGRIAALRGVSLHVDQGEAVSIVGPNGAGKSTALNTISGLVRPSRGEISFEGSSIVGKTPEQIFRLGIGLVPEGRRIFGTLTVGENLQLGMMSHTDRSSRDRELEQVVERFPILKDYYGAPADQLSGGEQQQLAIARALLGRPRMMLLDEPSLGLAPMLVKRVFEVLEELREEGVTILLVEQAAKRAVQFASRSYVLRTGRVVLSGAREELLATADFAHAYLGAVEANR